jgi:hypothetical protein
MTPEEALTALYEFADDAIGEDKELVAVPTHISDALQTLADFIKQVNEHGSTDLEWGEPGDCFERICDDEDVAHDLGFEDAYGEDFSRWLREGEYADIKAKAKELGVGRHYGDPHCIWCLQAS